MAGKKKPSKKKAKAEPMPYALKAGKLNIGLPVSGKGSAASNRKQAMPFGLMAGSGAGKAKRGKKK